MPKRYIRHMSRENRLEIIIDIFLPNWRRQARFVRHILAATTNSTETHECVIREGIVVGHMENTQGGKGRERDIPIHRRQLSNHRRSKRDLKISMQIRRIIIPTVRFAPEFYGGSLDLGLRRYIVYRIQCYGIWCAGAAGLLSYELQRRNPNPNG